MKKSKLIVPAALAVMLLSTAASVTGTVAWFTANRAVTVDASEFEVTTTDGNLEVAITPIAHTAVETANPKKVLVADFDDNDANTVNAPYKFTDASVDIQPNSAVVYQDKEDSALDPVTKQPTEFEVVNATDATPSAVSGYTLYNKTYNSSATGVAVAASWDLTFTYTFPSETTNVNLFFNTADSVVVLGDGSTTDSPAGAGKGFRIGMYTTNAAIVWADNEVQGNCNYIYEKTAAVAGVDANDDGDYNDEGDTAPVAAVYEQKDSSSTKPVATYYTNSDPEVSTNPTWVGKIKSVTAGSYNAYTLATASSRNNNSPVTQLVDSTVSLQKAVDASANQNQRGDYLGTFTSESVTIVVHCFAWFEGTDPWIVNETFLESVSASIKFYTRRNA